MSMKDLDSEELCSHCLAPGEGYTNSCSRTLCEGRWCEEAYEIYLEEKDMLDIKRVIHNDPATVVIWEDDSKTIVKAGGSDNFHPTFGVLMAYFQKGTGMSKRATAKYLASLEEHNNG